jgi:transcriptional regulator with XRE-family HTH domain
LAAIRKIAGWTAEELGDMIGVTKQTISNLETGNSKMTPTQYIAIRAVLDSEMERSPENAVLPKVLWLLLDKDEPVEGKEYDALRESITAVSASAAAGASGAVLGGVLAGTLSATGLAMLLPLAGPIAVGAAAISGALGFPWLKKITESNKMKEGTNDKSKG